MRSTLFPIILAGGSGTRLWPLSRKNFPKQFLCLQGEESLLQQTFTRAASLAIQDLLIVSNEAHYFLCQEQLQSKNIPLKYLLEPIARNTAPALASAALYLMKTAGRDAIMLILPSDHLITDTSRWQAAMLLGANFAAKEGRIVAFGIKPSSATTGYGYIQKGCALDQGVHAINAFHEKPDSNTAEIMLQDGHYLWNSGMFICKVGVYLEELERFAPDILSQTQKALSKAHYHHNFIRLDENSFSECRNESIDFAIMEHTDRAAVIPIDMPWSDLGCWTSVSEVNETDPQGNTLSGNVIAKECYNCLVRSEKTLITTMGIQNQIIVATADAILIADKSYSQQVKNLVESLKENHADLLEDHPRVLRPWGYYEILVEGASFKVKRLMIRPGAKLSLQAHQHRAEHWVIVAGEAEIINGSERILLTVNQSTYIPKNTRHRLSNPGVTPLYVIEVQSGDYLGEDDIQRFDDIYQRETVGS